MSDLQYRLRGSDEWIDAREMPKLQPGMEVIRAGGDLNLRSLTAQKCTGEKLQPWEKEMAECEAAFVAANPLVGDMCQFVHHSIPFERLYKPWRNRLDHVRKTKKQCELAWRFRMMRPVTVPLADAVRALLSAVRR